MRGTKSVISSDGPTVQLANIKQLCYCYSCGEANEKTGSLRISFAKHQDAFCAAEPPRTYLCLSCAGGIASSIISLITDEVIAKR